MRQKIGREKLVSGKDSPRRPKQSNTIKDTEKGSVNRLKDMFLVIGKTSQTDIKQGGLLLLDPVAQGLRILPWQQEETIKRPRGTP